MQQATIAGLAVLDRMPDPDPHGVFALIRQRVEQRNFAAWERLGTTPEVQSPSELYARARLAMIAGERQRVLQIRAGGTVASDVVAEVLAMLDVEESMLDSAVQTRVELHEGQRVDESRQSDQCVDLDAAPAVAPVADPVCAECLANGSMWVALRLCLACGQVGCCDSSPSQHHCPLGVDRPPGDAVDRAR